MRIIPVLDLMHGQVVRGIGGQRDLYQPLRSPIAASADPLQVARGFRNHFGLTELYVADLDAIAGRPPAIETYTALQFEGFTLSVDAGLRYAADAKPLLAAKVGGIIAGLETLADPEALAALLPCVGTKRLVFSLDLKKGQPLTRSQVWPTDDPSDIAVAALKLGVQRLLVLDLACVGMGIGTGTETLCARLKKEYPNVEVLTGGGVRGPEDLTKLRRCGVDGVLVASALHDGRITNDDVQALQNDRD